STSRRGMGGACLGFRPLRTEGSVKGRALELDAIHQHYFSMETGRDSLSRPAAPTRSSSSTREVSGSLLRSTMRDLRLEKEARRTRSRSHRMVPGYLSQKATTTRLDCSISRRRLREFPALVATTSWPDEFPSAGIHLRLWPTATIFSCPTQRDVVLLRIVDTGSRANRCLRTLRSTRWVRSMELSRSSVR